MNITELNINPNSNLITLLTNNNSNVITINVNYGSNSNNSSVIDDVGILNLQNNPIVDNDNLNTFASKTQSQIDSLNYTKADRPNGVTTGGEIETGVDYITVSATSWMIGFVNYSAPIITFSNIALSGSGNQRYIAIYGNTLNEINKLEGDESTLAVYPDLPSNTIVIGYVLVGDGVISSPTPDLSAYATTNWVFNWSEPKILRSTRSTNYRFDTPNHPSQIIRNGGTVDIGIQCYYTNCKINGVTNKTVVVKPNQFAFIKAIQNGDDNYMVFVVDEIPSAGGGILEPTADGLWLRSKVGSAFSWVESYTKTALDTLFGTKLNKDGSNADTDINIGNFGLNTEHVKINGTAGQGHIGLKHQSADLTASGSETSIGANSTGRVVAKNASTSTEVLAYKSEVDAKQDSLGFTPANRAGDTFTGNITASNLSGTNTGDETNSTIKTKLGQANATTDGWLSSTDWNIFNSKINSSALTPYLLSTTAATTYASLTGSYANPSWITSLAWNKLTNTPTTLSGYGITDAYPLTGNPSGFLTNVPAQSFASLTGKPTTLNGYGITDAWSIGGNAITALSNFGSTSNFGISFIANSVKQIELLPIASSVAYLSLFSGTSANGTFNISVKN
jgi:hypothetical protein